ncbi:ParB/RepB/Spo0J family partition protein [Mycolicibacterium tusciae]|uniref:ParB/RepB/Spo0J family partition protein n=1 Tax=Mycolicibacterium tusciae TaxID=75922 RepID=UPI00024A4710|nr:ParB N-terminal domain-containing protein [Mycolicibacterium tusciae]
MSENITTDSDTTAQVPAAGTLEHLDPQTLELETNVRDDASLDADFVASIKEHGVLNPIAAVRGHDGVVRVRAGQRRTLAAREAGLASVPVYVRHSVAGDDEKAQVLERVPEQIVENDKRLAITEAQRARGIQQMLDAGVSVTKVAKSLSIGRDTVKSVATAAGSQAAMEALDSGQLSLAEAAVLSEFDDDADAIARLIEVAGTNRFDHRVAEIRQERESQKAYQEVSARYVEKGYRLLDDDSFPEYGDPTCVELRHLRNADGMPATEESITNPAHWAVYLTEEDGYVDNETGEAVDYQDIDWYSRHSGKVTEGKRDPNSVTEVAVWSADWFCTDYAAAGLALGEQLAHRVEALAREDADDVDGDDEHDHQDAETQAVAAAEAQRRERKKVIALNKLGQAAQQVRREFIAEKILTRKTPPKGAAIFVAKCVTHDVRLIEEYHGGEVAAELLGVSDMQAVHKLVADLPATSDGRAQVITLALVLGALEARTGKDAWRGMGGWGRYVGPAELLGFLVDNGYPLADVERVILGEQTADALYDSLTDQAEPADDE